MGRRFSVCDACLASDDDDPGGFSRDLYDDDDDDDTDPDGKVFRDDDDALDFDGPEDEWLDGSWEDS